MRILGTVASSSREVPLAPTIGTATNVPSGRAFNNGRADVTFTAPAFSGGLPILDYTVTSSPGGFTATGASSPISVTGLQSSVSYTFTVTARTAIGSGPASAASNSITATTVPQAPTIGTATAASGTTVTVAYTAGATGGAAISAYTATSSPGSITGTGASPITISGLTTGTAYTFTVTATNANGTSAASAASNSVTPAKTLGAFSVSTAYPTIVGQLTNSSASVTSGPMFVQGSSMQGGSTVYYSIWYQFNGSTWSNRGSSTVTAATVAASHTSANTVHAAGGENAFLQDAANYWNGSSLASQTTNLTRAQAFGTSLGGTTFIFGGGVGGAGNSSQVNYRTGTGSNQTATDWPFSGQAVGFTNGNFTRAYTNRDGYSNQTVYYLTTLAGAWSTSWNWPAWTSANVTTLNGDMLAVTYGGNGQPIYRVTDGGVFTSLRAISSTGYGFGFAGNGVASGTQLSVVGGYNGTSGTNTHYIATYA